MMKKPSLFSDIFPQLFVSLIASLNTVSEGMLYSWTAPVMPQLLSNQTSYNVTKSDEFYLESLYLASGFVGLGVTMYCVDNIGRKGTILLASSVSLVSWILTTVGGSVFYIYLSRVLCGIVADVAFVATPMYISEIASERHRGFLVGILYFCELIGIVLMYSIGPFTKLYVPAVLGIALLALQLATLPFMPESPHYLVTQDRKYEAAVALKRLRGPHSNPSEELDRLVLSIEKQKSERGGFRDFVLIPSNRRAFFIVFVLIICQQFSAITVILMNLHVILIKADSVYMDASSTGILFSVLSAVSALVCLSFVDKIGRKILLVVSSVLTGICLIVLGIYFQLKSLQFGFVESISWIPTVAVMAYSVAFKLGLGFLPQTISTELYPNNVKAIGMTLTDGSFVLAGTLSVILYEKIAYFYEFYIPFYIFGTVSMCTTLFIIFCVPETTNKTFQEIQDMLKRKK